MVRELLLILVALATLNAVSFGGEFVGNRLESPVDELIRQLEHPDFRKRNEAENRLIEMGTANIPALEAAAAGGGAEVKYRIERVLGGLKKLQARQQLDALKENPWTVGGKITRVWEQYHEVVGDSPAARALFISMMKCDPQLTLAPSEGPAREQMLLEHRCMELRNFQQLVRSEPVRIGNAASILFVMLVCEKKPSPLAVSVANFIIENSDFSEALNDSQMGAPLRSLLAHWIMRSGLVSAHSRLMLAIRYEIPQGIVPAREMISNGEMKTSQPQFPILFLARYGGTDALSDLEALLDETKELSKSTQGSANGETTFTSEVRDVALVALLHVTAQDPRLYGFTRLKPDSRYIYSPGSIGFESDQQRRTALALWHQWRKRHLPFPLAPWPDASEGTLVDFQFWRFDAGFERATFRNEVRRKVGAVSTWFRNRDGLCPRCGIQNREAKAA